MPSKAINIFPKKSKTRQLKLLLLETNEVVGIIVMLRLA
jgi:hypothetical protein